MKLVVISPETNIKDEIPILIQLFESGLEAFHIRKPHFVYEEMERYILDVPEEYWSRLVLHSHYDLHYKYDLGGLHLNSKTTDLNHEFRSSSVHSFKELDDFKHDLVDYILLSPVFDSISKQGYKANFNETEIKALLSKPRSNDIYALGGVNMNNIDKCMELGFDGVALLGAVWQSDDAANSFNTIKNKCQKFALSH